MEAQRKKNIIEAAVLVADEPLNEDALLQLFDEVDRPDKPALRALLAELGKDYAERGVELREVASGFRFQARQELGPWVSRLWQERPPRYSRATLETLALIAYRQPITRGEIEDVRGVSVSTQIMKTLLERGWVRVVGHRDVVGRPAMYATTREFLDYFNLQSLEDLPPLAEIRDLDRVSEGLELEAGLDQNSGQPDVAAEEVAGEMQSRQSAMSAPADGDQPMLQPLTPDTPEIDENTLMDMAKVDAVLENFEAQFRPGRDDAPADETAPEAEVQGAADTQGQDVKHTETHAGPHE